MRTKIVAKDKVLWNAAGRPSALGGEALNLVKLRFESGTDYKSERTERPLTRQSSFETPCAHIALLLTGGDYSVLVSKVAKATGLTRMSPVCHAT